jgi:hypothetical protein
MIFGPKGKTAKHKQNMCSVRKGGRRGEVQSLTPGAKIKTNKNGHQGCLQYRAIPPTGACVSINIYIGRKKRGDDNNGYVRFISYCSNEALKL